MHRRMELNLTYTNLVYITTYKTPLSPRCLCNNFKYSDD